MTNEENVHTMRDLKKKIKELAKNRGRHTELITVYVAAGHNLDKVNAKLFEEQGTASNIKSTSTRKNVTSALTKILQAFKLFKRTPENGLVIFCGNVAEQEGREDYLVETIIPPKPLGLNLYRCSQKFVLEPLEEMLETGEAYGIVVIDRRDADIALLKGTRVEILDTMDSMVPGKFRAGGQSAQRFERVIEGMAQDFYKKVGERATQAFNNVKELKGILVGGPGPTKNDFLDAKHLSTELQKKVISVQDIGYTGEQGIDELIKKSENILQEAEIVKETQIMDRFLNELGKDTGLAAYGEREVRQALEAGAIDTLLLSESLEGKRQDLKCMKCNHEHVKTEKDGPTLTCEKCGYTMELLEEKDLIEEFIELAESIGSESKIISVETQQGQQLKSLGGVAAILRFKQG